MSVVIGQRLPVAVVPGMWFLVLAGLVLLVYRDVSAGLWALWFDPVNETYSHGVLLLALSVGIAGRILWLEPNTLRWRPSMAGAALLVTAVLLWMLATLVVVRVGAMLSAWLVLVAAVWAVFGFTALKRLALPLGLIVFAVPLWNVINEPLRLITSHAVSVMLGLTGVSHLLEGAVISVAVGSFYVDDTCTGLRQLVVAMPLGLLFAAWLGLRPVPAAMAFLMSIAVSIAMNTLRIYIVVLAGVMTDMQHYFVRDDHITLGWALFGAGMVAYFFLASRLIPEKWLHNGRNRRDIERSTVSPAKKPLVGGAVVASLLVALAVPVGASRLAPDLSSVAGQELLLPERFGAWRLDAAQAVPTSVTGLFHGADAERAVVYRHDNGLKVVVHVAWFAAQREGHKAVFYANRPFDRASWRQLTWTAHPVGRDAIPPVVREDLLLSGSGRQRVAWSWYQSGGRMPVSELSAVVAGVRGALCGRPDAARWVITPLEPGEAGNERMLLGDFLRAGGGTLAGTVESLSGHVYPGAWC